MQNNLRNSGQNSQTNDTFEVTKKELADTIRVTVYGFCPVENIKAIYKTEGLNTHKSLIGDYTVMIKDGSKTIYITDFAGTHCPMWFPPQGLSQRYNYDAFFKAIDDAVKLRCTDRPVIAMSSGHDSGCIVASAIKQNLEFDIITITAKEKRDIIGHRAKYIEERSDANINVISLWETTQNGHEIVAKHIPNRVLLSGLGADEVLTTADWQLCEEFLKQAQETYIDIDVRYPLLDYDVFREWHRLIPELKGYMTSKLPMTKYLEQLDFPYNKGRKIPFDVT